MVRPIVASVARTDAEVGREIRLLCQHEDPKKCLIYEQLVDKQARTDWQGNFLTDEQVDVLRQKPCQNSTGYAAQHGAWIAFTIETAYFGRPHNRTSQDSIRALGRKVALGLEHYLCMSED